MATTTTTTAGDGTTSSSGGTDWGALLQRKMGPLATWQWLGLATIAGLGFYLYERHKNGGSSAAAQNTTTSTSTPGLTPVAQIPQFVNQVSQTVQNTTPITVPTTGSSAAPTDVYNAAGRDLGQYRYGGDELSYIQQNIGKFGFTQSLYNDVLKAYQQVAAKSGVGQANSMHYSWIGPGNVQAIPVNNVNAVDIKQLQ